MRFLALIRWTACGLASAILLCGCENADVGTVGADVKSEELAVGDKGAANSSAKKKGKAEAPLTRATRK